MQIRTASYLYIKVVKSTQGLVLDTKVVCPLHSWKICFEDGQAEAPDIGCAKKYPVKVEDGVVFVEV